MTRWLSSRAIALGNASSTSRAKPGNFLANFGNQYPLMRPLFNRLERRSAENHGMPVNYAASYWTPPMTPKLAFDLESGQIEDLGIASMVSITDHDNIKAPMLLRAVR